MNRPTSVANHRLQVPGHPGRQDHEVQSRVESVFTMKKKLTMTLGASPPPRQNKSFSFRRFRPHPDDVALSRCPAVDSMNVLPKFDP